MQKKNLTMLSKWTSVEELHGWRHFHICGRRYSEENGELLIELMATCDRTVRFFVRAVDMTDSGKFVAGWQSTLKAAAPS